MFYQLLYAKPKLTCIYFCSENVNLKCLIFFLLKNTYFCKLIFYQMINSKLKIIIAVSLFVILSATIFTSCRKGEPDNLVLSLEQEANNISTVYATYSGKFWYAKGMWSITEKGVCWSTTNKYPTINDSKTIDGSGIGDYTSFITFLESNTTYYVRAYATYSRGTVYSAFYGTLSTPPHAPITFGADSTYGTLSDNEGNIYKTIPIGTQTWMAENLKVKKFRNGTDIPNITNITEWNNQTVGASCDYYNSTTNSETYGRLYSWGAVNSSETLCPSGWHIPTDSEWKKLEITLGFSQADADKTGDRGKNQGDNLRESSGSHWKFNGYGDNSTGFSAIPSGLREFNGEFKDIEKTGYWWTASQSDETNSWSRNISRNKINRSASNKKNAYSVRCVQD